ncbi:uncharacterized protein LOC120434061 isoform X2 [Oreochromis aureus]|uniref:uncharacterized protein LOC120434061 isoform X2 n=1 Tax=Oreochromis aureus TaxID=47969 RepID=UPI001952A3DA|nr:uncharacterized protein LOC120434061 isoform X2 [Oreochromis aureus]
MEIAVCRHGVLAALNMFRGEIFAYPLFLQRKLAANVPGHITFLCSDVACKYFPYLTKVAQQCPELRNLLSMRPFLSVMHAKAHTWKCEIKWGGAFQDGAGSTVGEEVEKVNSFLSRAAITTKANRHADPPGFGVEQKESGTTGPHFEPEISKANKASSNSRV